MSAATEIPAREPVGAPLDRVDGRLKVTGGARYAAEFPQEHLAHAYLVQSAIPAGRITRIDTADAERAPGVLAILTHRNAPRLVRQPAAQSGGREGASKKSAADEKPGGGAQGKPGGGSSVSGGGSAGADPFAKPYVLQDERVRHFGQTVALVIAGSFEQARDAAARVRLEYQAAPAALSFAHETRHSFVPEKLLAELKPETSRGDFAQGWREGAVRIDATYSTPNLHNNPMEPHATIAAWDGARLIVYDSTQNVNGTQRNIATLFGLAPDNVRVIAPFIGGGFGCKGPTWEHTIAAVMAARAVQRPVKLVVARRQMFPAVGYRPHTQQRLRLAATPEGRLTALAHETITATNRAHEYIEAAGVATPMLYATPHLLVSHRAVPLDWPRGTIMRAPGECAGVYPLECAMDELAYALRMDPIELRRVNEPAQDPHKKIPWSSRSLLQCFDQGAARFGWSRRNPTPRAMTAGGKLLGWGVATATYPTNRRPTSARVRLTPEGRAIVQLAATDLGTGTYTALTQIAAAALRLAPERVTVEIGDTNFPRTPGSGGSWGVASYGSAVHEACLAVREKLPGLAAEEPLADFLRRNPLRQPIESRVDSQPGKEKEQHSMHAFGAHFAEVQVDPDTGEVRVSRFVGAFACGRIINAKTARSQFAGAIVMGLGMALSEASILDPRRGNFVNADLASYHVPVNRDVPAIDVIFVEEQDPFVNPLGTKGIGEIGIVGVAAAVANAVYHATGRRIRDLPLTPDKVLA